MITRGYGSHYSRIITRGYGGVPIPTDGDFLRIRSIPEQFYDFKLFEY